MKRIIPCLAVAATLAIGGPQLLSGAVQQLGGPQLQTGQALAQKLSRCQGNYRMDSKTVCTRIWVMQCDGLRVNCRRVQRRRCYVKNVVRSACSRRDGYYHRAPKMRIGG